MLLIQKCSAIFYSWFETFYISCYPLECEGLHVTRTYNLTVGDIYKVCTVVDIRDLATLANFGSHWSRRFGMAGVEYQVFSLAFNIVLITLWHYVTYRGLVLFNRPGS